MTNWYVGQRVRCKDVSLINGDGSSWSNGKASLMVLVDGAEYTVREIFCNEAFGSTCIRLCEIRRGNYKGEEKGWRASRFEPIQTTSIESLRSLLSPTPEQMKQFEDELVD